MKNKTIVKLAAIALVMLMGTLQLACSGVGQVVEGTSQDQPAPPGSPEQTLPSGQSGSNGGVVNFGG